jgi:hypothetical protein
MHKVPAFTRSMGMLVNKATVSLPAMDTSRPPSLHQMRYYAVGFPWPHGPPDPPAVPAGPAGVSWIPLVPSGPSGVSLGPPTCPPLVSHGSYSSIVMDWC